MRENARQADPGNAIEGIRSPCVVKFKPTTWVSVGFFALVSNEVVHVQASSIGLRWGSFEPFGREVERGVLGAEGGRVVEVRREAALSQWKYQ